MFDLSTIPLLVGSEFNKLEATVETSWTSVEEPLLLEPLEPLGILEPLLPLTLVEDVADGAAEEATVSSKIQSIDPLLLARIE